MRSYIYSFLIVLFCACSFSSSADEPQPSPDLVYVIPIKGMIERGLVYAVRRGIQEAETQGASAIILDMDTPGGKLGSCEEIVYLLINTSIPTCTFVNPRAMSAGAIISFATDEIYMTPAALIGDAMPILMSPLPFGSPQEPSPGLKEKIMSPTVALIRSAAQQTGHDTDLAEAMVRPEFEYKIGDLVISPAGELVTLTSQDAEQKVGEDQHPLLSAGTFKTLDELLASLGKADSEVVTIEITTAEKIARAIEGFPLSGILLALGLLGLYIEFKTPGFGVPGLGGMALLAIWFWGHHIAGVAGLPELILFMLGIALVMAEIFVIPGFGITGISGIICIVISLLMAMVEHMPGRPTFDFSYGSIDGLTINAGLTVVLMFGAALLLARFLTHAPGFNAIALSKELLSDDGYSSSADTSDLIGRSGTATTDLHPAGFAQLGDRRVNVVTRGEFIQDGSPIVVAEAHGNRIVVEQKKEGYSPS